MDITVTHVMATVMASVMATVIMLDELAVKHMAMHIIIVINIIIIMNNICRKHKKYTSAKTLIYSYTIISFEE